MNLFFTQLLTIGDWFESNFVCIMFLGEYDFPEE